MSILEARGLPLGHSDAGRAWCIKALHPSDPAGEVLGVPDQSAQPVVMQNFTQVVSLAMPAAILTDTWDAEVYILSDPSCFGCFYTRDSAGTYTTPLQGWPNTAYGATVPLAASAWCAAVEAWRLCYFGVTLTLDSTDLYNSGNVVAAQYVARPRSLGMMCPDALKAPMSAFVYWQDKDTPTYEDVALMPASYTGQAKYGCYMPMRLDPNHARWRSMVDSYVYELTGKPVVGQDTYTMYSGVSGTQTDDGLYPGCVIGHYETNQIKGDRHLLPCSGLVGCISLRGIHKSATLRFTFRCGFETQVQPGTPQAQFARMSVPFDRQAIDAYFAISRTLKDAYPAEYNDFGRMWDLIKGAAKFLGPAVRAIPAVGPALYTLGSVAGRAIDSAVQKKKKGKSGPTPEARKAAKRPGGK